MTIVDAVEVLHARTAVYTRDPVVERLLDLVDWPSSDRRLLEPSCGDGAFLVAALNRLLAREPNATPARIASMLQGFEVHAGAAEEARGRVAAALKGHGWAADAAKTTAVAMVHAEDFLTAGPSLPEYHVVAGNPPYLRFANVPGELQSEYLRVVPKYACGDLLHAFLDRCAKVLLSDGEIAFVTADRWLQNEGAGGLRAAMGRRFGIHHFERLEAATAFYRPKVRKAGTPPRVHPVAVVLRRNGKVHISKAPVYPEGITVTSGVERTLGDVARVRLAPWLGKDGIFIVDAEAAQGLPPRALVPIVDTTEVSGGVLGRIERFAIRTVPGEEPPAEVQAHLRKTLPAMAPRGRREPFWLPPESWHAWDLSQESIVVPRISKGLRFVRVPAGVLPVNHNLSVVCAGSADLAAVERVLASPAARGWVEARAARLDGGYVSITTRLLRGLPFAEESSK